MIVLENVSKSFPVESPILKRKISEVKAIKNISFIVKDGETLGIVGESGSGKTTLAKLIAGFIKPDIGKITIDGIEINKIPPIEKAKKIQMIFQDPFSSLNPRHSVGKIIKEAIDTNLKSKREKITPQEETQIIKKLLKTVGLPQDILNNYPHQFSGGQRQRIAIARALAVEPEILIADEPLSNLDFTTQALLVNLFFKLKQEFNFTFIFISHDILLVDYISTRIIVLKDGEIVEETYPGKIVMEPKTDYTKKLISATPL